MGKSYDKTISDDYIVFDKREAKRYLSAKDYETIIELHKTIKREKRKLGEEVNHYLVCNSNIRYADKIARYIKFGTQFYDKDSQIREKYKLYDIYNPGISMDEVEKNWEVLYDKADELLRKHNCNCRVDRSQKHIRIHGFYDGPFCMIYADTEYNGEERRKLYKLCKNIPELEFLRVCKRTTGVNIISGQEDDRYYAEFRLHMKNIIAEELEKEHKEI